MILFSTDRSKRIEVENGKSREVLAKEFWMKVRELVKRLATADPESVVLFLEAWSWIDEADEVATVMIPTQAWTFEESSESGREYSVFYPGNDRDIEVGSTQYVRQRQVHVVILSNGTSNLERDSQPLASDSDSKRRP